MTSGYTPYTIANMKTGLEQDVDSFLIAEDAFPTLQNAYLWRGRVYKKGGNQLLGRLGVRNNTIFTRTAGADNIAVNLAGAPIEPGTIIITDGVTTFTDNGTGGWTITGAGTAGAATNYTTGAVNVIFNAGNLNAPVTARYIVAVNNSSPVMGLPTRDTTTVDNLMAFDMTQSYSYNTTTTQFDNVSFYKNSLLPVTWTGSNADFFDSQNYQLAMFSTNNIPGANFYIITNITQAVNGIITTSVNHSLVAGDVVYVNNVLGMPEINNRTITVTAPVGANSFGTNIDTTAFGAYTSGGIVWVPSRSISGDGIRWFDGTGWVNFNPPTNGPLTTGSSAAITASGNPNIVQGCLLIFAYKGYLVLLNTFEGIAGVAPTNFQRRARFSQLGNVYYSNPVPAGSTAVPSGQEWYQTPGRGGFTDAPTGEAITGGEFIKDTLVVYFESSIFRLTFTGNTVLPFIWEKVNTEVGSESTFSTIPFDRQILSVGTNGIYSCDSVNVERKDRIIPDVVFEFHNGNQGAQRVQGIRDFFSEQCYWTYADSENNPIFPNRMLVYNYLTESFAIFKNYYTSLGHTSTPVEQTWGNSTNSFESYDRTWGSFSLQTAFPIIVAGNQQGYVFTLQQSDGSYNTINDPSLSITAITNASPSVFTVPNHNLEAGDFLTISGGVQSPSLLNTPFKIFQVLSANTFTLQLFDGTIVENINYTTKSSQISILDNLDILTKNINPFFSQGRSMRLGYADFYFDVATGAQISVNLYQNDNHALPIETHTIDLTDAYDSENTKFWRRVYFQSQGQFLSLELIFTDNVINNQQPDAGQMFFPVNTSAAIILHGLILWMKPAGRLLTNI